MSKSNNDFGLPDEEFAKLQNTGYFRGVVVSEFKHIKREIKRQYKVDEEIKEKLSELPCHKQDTRIKFAFLFIAILFLLLGYANFPFILKFFGM